MKKDRLFEDAPAEPFDFSAEVVEVYEDMVLRSIPSYRTLLSSLPLFAERHLDRGPLVYDLGASKGAVTRALLPCLKPGQSILAIEKSPAMSAYLKAAFASEPQVQPIEGDIRTFDYPKAQTGLIVSNFTIQFIPPQDRPALFSRLYDALAPGGALIVSEKITHENSEVNALWVAVHERFKALQGYSPNEVENKKRSLVGVMFPSSWESHEKTLKSAGFTLVAPWFLHYNFGSLIAVK